uniref:Uncharacterized protein n=1 Tax=Strongyloides venezuelensis TaxID=75913 RepID=A0A0K0EU57_STRVS
MAINFGSVGFLIGRKLILYVDNNYNEFRNRMTPPGFLLQLESSLFFPLSSLWRPWYPIIGNTKITKCFVQQRNKQTDNGTKYNGHGNRTLVEKIADNGGIKLAHRALMKYHKEKICIMKRYYIV